MNNNNADKAFTDDPPSPLPLMNNKKVPQGHQLGSFKFEVCNKNLISSVERVISTTNNILREILNFFSG